MKKIRKKPLDEKNSTSSKKQFPEGWDLTVSDLLQERKDGKREQISKDEFKWARKYEQSLIPPNYRFPQKGDLYQSKFDQTIDYLTAWAAPYTGGGSGTLYKDEKIWIDSDSIEKNPIGTYAMPVNYQELEARFIPSNIRANAIFDCFYLYVDTKTLNENFELIQTDFEKDDFV